MTIIEKLKRLPSEELEIIEDLFNGITEGAFVQIFRDMEHGPRDRKTAARALERLQQMDEEDAPTPALDSRGRAEWLSDTQIMQLAYQAMCENEHATVPGLKSCPPPFNENYDVSHLLRMMEKQRIPAAYGH